MIILVTMGTFVTIITMIIIATIVTLVTMIKYGKPASAPDPDPVHSRWAEFIQLKP